MNLGDRLYAVLAPARAVRRAARNGTLLSQFRGFGFRGPGQYEGANSARRALRSWNPLAQSPDDDSSGDLPTLRSRARDLERNAPLATGATSTVVTSVVGPGLKLQSSINRELLGLSEAQASAWQQNTESLFRIWTAQCDLTRVQGFNGLQDIVFRSMLGSGDVFVVRRFVERTGEPFATRLQVVEADRVATPPDMEADPNVVDGVEMDKETGAPVRYWVANQYQHSSSQQLRPLEFKAVPAFMPNGVDRSTLHLFRRLRPGLTRGIPYLAPVIETLKQLDRYTEAEIMAAIVGGMTALVVTTEQGEGLANMEAASEVGVGVPPTGGQEIAMDYGAILNLMPGESATQMAAQRPNSGFDAFVTSLLRQVGTSLELPFELLVKHFTASYSASRAALLEAWRYFLTRREHLAAEFCQPAFEWFLFEAVARGVIIAPGFLESPLRRAAWSQARWTGRPQGSLDPTREVRAALERVYGNVSTLAEVTTELTGGDWAQNVDQRARERALMNERGVPIGQAYGLAPEDENPDAGDSNAET